MSIDAIHPDHAFAMILKKGLDVGVALNAASHMAACLVARATHESQAAMSFVDYRDAGGGLHPVSALPLVVLSAKSSGQLRGARVAAQREGIGPPLF
jgi:hypothetical protein